MTNLNLETTNLAPEQRRLLEEHFDKLLAEYESNDSLSLESLIPIIGRKPKIPQSPDMDAMLEAWDAQVEYSKKVTEIEELISQYFKADK